MKVIDKTYGRNSEVRKWMINFENPVSLKISDNVSPENIFFSSQMKFLWRKVSKYKSNYVYEYSKFVGNRQWVFFWKKSQTRLKSILREQNFERIIYPVENQKFWCDGPIQIFHRN